jgi:hypothetical protein
MFAILVCAATVQIVQVSKGKLRGNAIPGNSGTIFFPSTFFRSSTTMKTLESKTLDEAEATNLPAGSASLRVRASDYEGGSDCP